MSAAWATSSRRAGCSPVRLAIAANRKPDGAGDRDADLGWAASARPGALPNDARRECTGPSLGAGYWHDVDARPAVRNGAELAALIIRNSPSLAVVAQHSQPLLILCRLVASSCCGCKPRRDGAWRLHGCGPASISPARLLISVCSSLLNPAGEPAFDVSFATARVAPHLGPRQHRQSPPSANAVRGVVPPRDQRTPVVPAPSP